MEKQKFLQFFLLLAFLFTSMISGPHIYETCGDQCDSKSIGSVQLEGSGSAVHTHESDHDDDEETCPSSEHFCCHHLSYLSNGQLHFILFPPSLSTVIGSQELISDPHVRGPFQPPRV